MHTHIPPDLSATVEAVAKSLAPNVVRIRYTVGEDWQGEPAVHFRVLLSDSASRRPHLLAVANRVEDVIRTRLDFEAMDVLPYFNYRSWSEQVALADSGDWKEWE